MSEDKDIDRVVQRIPTGVDAHQVAVRELLEELRERRRKERRKAAFAATPPNGVDPDIARRAEVTEKLVNLCRQNYAVCGTSIRHELILQGLFDFLDDELGTGTLRERRDDDGEDEKS